MDKHDKREQILDAALAIFAENGFHGAPTSLLAKRAGIGVGTIYRYFADKDDLIHALFDRTKARARAWLDAEPLTETGLRERFCLLTSRICRYFLQHPSEFRFIEQYYFSPYSGNGCCETPDEDNRIENLLLEARRAQVIKDLPLPVMKAMVFGPLSSLAKEQNMRGRAIPETMIDQVVQASWDGLKR